MNINMFEDVGKSSTAGTKAVRTLVNQHSVNVLKNYTYPKRFEMKGTDHLIMINDLTCSVHTPLDSEVNYAAPQTNTWTLIALYHQNLDISIEDIISAFYDAVGKALFIPVGYIRNRNIDYFLVRQQNEALRELVKQRLQIQVNAWKLPLLVKPEVSVCLDGQVKPRRNIAIYLQRKIKELSPTGVLDLSQINKEPEFVDMKISMRNAGVCKLFFEELNSMKVLKTHPNFRHLKLCSNNIQSLEHFNRLYDIKFLQTLDLSDNNIMDIKELINLKDLNITELIIVQNPCSNYPKLEDKIHNFLPRLTKLNSKSLSNGSIQMETIQTGNDEISGIGDGTVIKANNFNSYRTRFDKLIYDQYWSQVILFHNKRYSMSEIMRELSSNLLRAVHFYPCYIKRLDNRDEFFLYKNTDALRQLFLTGLKIQMPGNSFTIDVQLRLNVAEYRPGQVNWMSKIQKAVFNRVKGDLLDLNDFPRDPEFSKMVVSLNSTITLDTILTNALKRNPNIEIINCENCNISICKGFEYLYTFQKLRILNLKNNNIKSLADFPRTTRIEDVYLSGNPVCNQTSFEYIRHVRESFKQAQFIDGHRVFGNNCIVTYQNFLINMNAYMPVSEFVKYYFHQWDTFERSKLLKLYDNHSVFTMSMHYDYHEGITAMSIGQIYPRIQEYIKFSRNLAKISNMSDMSKHVYIGGEISKIFGSMCKSKHDFRSLTVDVAFYDEKSEKLLITVSGAFEEFATDTDEHSLPFGFTRSFLITIKNGIYTINNDMLLLCSPTEQQMEVLRNKVEVVMKDEVQELCRDLLPSEGEDQSLKLAIFLQLTECNKQFCTKLLQDNKWNLKVALACFNSMLEKDEIPDNTFV